jgi:hypothetical protein
MIQQPCCESSEDHFATIAGGVRERDISRDPGLCRQQTEGAKCRQKEQGVFMGPGGIVNSSLHWCGHEGHYRACKTPERRKVCLHGRCG